MNKLHSIAFYVLITPVISLAASSVLAQQTPDRDVDHDQQNTQPHQTSTSPTPGTVQGSQNTQRSGQPGVSSTAVSPGTQRAGQSDSRAAANQLTSREQTQHRGYMNAAPANGLQAKNLMGVEVTASADESVGEVNDLIIDENGQVVAIVVAVGGFLGMGERDIAIGWDDVMKSGTDDEIELRIDATREQLSSAPEFENDQ